MRIQTTHIFPPIPVRGFDWCAVDAETYDGEGCPIGFGATKQAAIADLVSQFRENETRRDRLLRFIGHFYPDYERRQLAWQRAGRAGLMITLDDLTDPALERFAQQLRSAFWFSKKLQRHNRAIARANA